MLSIFLSFKLGFVFFRQNLVLLLKDRDVTGKSGNKTQDEMLPTKLNIRKGMLIIHCDFCSAGSFFCILAILIMFTTFYLQLVSIWNKNQHNKQEGFNIFDEAHLAKIFITIAYVEKPLLDFVNLFMLIIRI